MVISSAVGRVFRAGSDRDYLDGMKILVHSKSCAFPFPKDQSSRVFIVMLIKISSGRNFIFVSKISGRRL